MNTIPFVRPRWGPRACIDAALGLVLAADVAPDKAETMGWPVYPVTRLPGHTRLITQIVVVFLGSCKLLFRSESDVTSYRSPNVDGSSSGIRSLEAFTGCQGCACGAAGAMRLQETHCDAKVK